MTVWGQASNQWENKGLQKTLWAGGEQLPGPVVCGLSRLAVPPKPSFYSTYGKHLQFCRPDIPGFTFPAVDLIDRVEMKQQGPGWTRDPCLDQQRVPSLWML